PTPSSLDAFPTRRSSDLARIALHGACALAGPLHPAASGVALARGRRVLGGGPMNNVFAALHPGQPIPREQIPQFPLADFRRAVIDRKSTRLNSSHLVISY